MSMRDRDDPMNDGIDACAIYHRVHAMASHRG